MLSLLCTTEVALKLKKSHFFKEKTDYIGKAFIFDRLRNTYERVAETKTAII